MKFLIYMGTCDSLTKQIGKEGGQFALEMCRRDNKLILLSLQSSFKLSPSPELATKTPKPSQLLPSKG